jgi:heat shock protein HslJ
MSVFPRLAAAVLVPLVLFGCGGAIPFMSPAGDSGVVKGTVSYRERTALPPDSILVLALTDTTPVIMTTPIVAETVVRFDGRQPPIPFELAFDPGRINRDHNYGVRAAIRSGQRVLFETAGSYPVITRGNPRQVDIQLVRTAEGLVAVAPTLVGTAWRLEDLGGAGVLDRVEATLEFPEAGRVSGQASCNRFFGFWEASGATLTIARLGATKKLCTPAMMEQESKYLSALEGAERFAIEGTTLKVHAKGLDQPMRFVRK